MKNAIPPNIDAYISNIEALAVIPNCFIIIFLRQHLKTIATSTKSSSHGGYTLIELMIAVAISGIILTAVCLAFSSQQKILTEQEMSIDILQSVRAAFSLMQHDIRMAGYDATWIDNNDDGLDDQRSHDLIDNDCDGSADHADQGTDEHGNLAHFTVAEPHYLQFRLDRLKDGDFCDSQDLIGFGFSSSRDRNRDGVADAGAGPLGRSAGASGLQPLAEHIQAVAFGYAFDDDNGAESPDGEIDTDSDHIIWGYDIDGDGNLDTVLDSNMDGIINTADDLNGDGIINDAHLPSAVPVDRIRAVAIWLLARTSSPLRGHSDTATYIVGNRIITPGDRFKRELMTTIVYCRNLGLR